MVTAKKYPCRKYTKNKTKQLYNITLLIFFQYLVTSRSNFIVTKGSIGGHLNIPNHRSLKVKYIYKITTFIHLIPIRIVERIANNCRSWHTHNRVQKLRKSVLVEILLHDSHETLNKYKKIGLAFSTFYFSLLIKLFFVQVVEIT